MLIADANMIVRRGLGDPAENFLVNNLVDGQTLFYDLPQMNVNPVGLIVQTVVSGVTSNLNSSTLYSAWSGTTQYNPGSLVTYFGNYFVCTQAPVIGTPPPQTNTDNGYWVHQIVYTLDSIPGHLTTNTPIPNNYLLVVSGQAWGLFTDVEINSIIYDAVRKHSQGQTITERYRANQNGGGGFIDYRDTPKELMNLPKHEESLVCTLAEIICLWDLATDSATEVNVVTPEGTAINREARYNQIMRHIESLTQWYNDQCAQWNVGMHRMETLQLRRVSRTTGRLVPVFRDREYDDHRYPARELPQIDRRDEDNSGVPSPIWNGSPL